ncbi:ferredoxin [Streptomyces sp. NBC_00582]|uniref:ferredoxin n=1 Tax=Streptomyces sp. NBC_00582 TaxID=2975783 RepID=UPI00106377A7|nr:ferredoxin [Streptomyces sp. NBC_00582]WUB61059.1 ferredoxin [Streptomyces sp. NBC_00582]
MSAARLRVDRERCIGAGMCALTAPEVFDQDPDDGRVLLLHPDPLITRPTATRMAAGVCPSGALTLQDRPTGRDAGGDPP